MLGRLRYPGQSPFLFLPVFFRRPTKENLRCIQLAAEASNPRGFSWHLRHVSPDVVLCSSSYRKLGRRAMLYLRSSVQRPSTNAPSPNDIGSFSTWAIWKLLTGISSDGRWAI